VENVSIVVREGEFILDIVEAALSARSSSSAAAERICGSNLYCGIEIKLDGS
jgi:hypothetical protein